MKRLRNILAEEGLRTASASSFSDTVERYIDHHLNLDESFKALGGRGGTNLNPDKMVIRKQEVKGGKRISIVYVELSASGVFRIEEDFSWEDYAESVRQKVMALTGANLGNFWGGGNGQLFLPAGKGTVWLLHFSVNENGSWDEGLIAYVNTAYDEHGEDLSEERQIELNKKIVSRGWEDPAGYEEAQLHYAPSLTGDLDEDAKAIAKFFKKAQADVKALLS